MTPDVIERFGDSIIQHGKANDRAYVMKVGKEDHPAIVDKVTSLALAEDYSKIFVKAPAFARAAFIENSFVEEGHIPGLFRGNEDGFFLSKFLSEERQKEKRPDLVSKVLRTARQKAGKIGVPSLSPGQVCLIMGKKDVEPMAQLYRKVFASYPFPIHNPAYLARTMDENLVYYGIRADDKLIALASTEHDFDGQNAELTDFATLPQFRRHGLASYLLEKMEEGLRKTGVQTAYTIARAYSFGMNITFAKHGYTYGGTLTNNTQISGDLESMVVWYKHL
jgi:putative beta-lysine N-acetyltransferase